jgi:hypothetical protein
LFIVRTSLIGVQYIVEALQLQTWRKGGGIPVSDEEAIDFSGVQYVFDVNGFEKKYRSGRCREHDKWMRGAFGL